MSHKYIVYISVYSDVLLIKHVYVYIFLFVSKYDLIRTEVLLLCTPSSTQPGFKLLTSDHDSTFHVTETYLKQKLLRIVPHKYIVYISIYSDVPFIKHVYKHCLGVAVTRTWYRLLEHNAVILSLITAASGVFTAVTGT